MPSVDHRSLAESIVDRVGGESNIAEALHCATRLRLRLKDEGKADDAAIEGLPGVIALMKAGGQYQIVVGDEVPLVHAELGRLVAPGDSEEGAVSRGNPFNRFTDLISSIVHPILWPLAGSGLLKAFLSAAVQWKWLSATSQTYTILNATADAVFHFLPMFLAVTAAKRFRANQFTAMAIAGALVYPAVIALDTGDPVRFLGIPVVMTTYTSSVIPIIVAVWLQGYLERFLTRVLPSVVRNFVTPLVTLAVMVPLILITVGPVTTGLSKALSSGIEWAFGSAPWLAGAVLGGLWQVFVVLGLHWSTIPLVLNDFATQGYSLLVGPMLPSVVAQSAACLAVLLRSRDAARRGVAGPAALSSLLAGVTEPAVYGVNLPLKRPFYFGMIGGAVGGAIAAAGGNAPTTFVFPSLVALPAFSGHGSFAAQLVGCGLAAAVAFTLTFLFVDRESGKAGENGEAGSGGGAKQAAPAPGETGTLDVLTPVAGRAVPITDVADKVFASRALGEGIGIVPSDGRFHAPVSGTLMAAMKSGHAYGIKTPDGVEVLVHIGIDTVGLDGKGFRPVVTKGQDVEAGDLLVEVDLDEVARAGYDTTTLLVVTNTAQLSAVTPVDGDTLEHGARALRVRV